MSRPNEPQLPAKVPSMPSWLGAHAKREWKRVTKLLGDAGVLTELDRTVLALYCSAVDDFLTCRAIIDREGGVAKSDKGGLYQHPAFGMMTNAWSRALKAGAELGLSPSSRPGIHAALPAKPDKLDEFLASKKDRYRRG